MSDERHPINQCHYGATVKTSEEKIDWQNLDSVKRQEQCGKAFAGCLSQLREEGV